MLAGKAKYTAALAALAMSALAACGGESSGTSAAENDDGSTTITLATVASDSGSQAFYGDELKFFEKQGLDVKVKIVANVPELAAAVESGDAHFALTSPTSVASASATGIPFRIVAGGAIYTKDNPGVWIMAPKGSSATSPKDLNGASIAVNALNTMPHLSTLATLEDAGVDPKKINTVTLDFTQVGQAFESKQVEAATVTAPFNYQIESDGIGTTMLSPYDAVNDGKDFANTIWFGKEDFVQDNKDVVDKFRAAIKETNAWANDPSNEKERKSILQKQTNLTDKSLKEMQLLQFGDEATPEMISPVLDLMERFEVLPKPVEADSIIAD